MLAAALALVVPMQGCGGGGAGGGGTEKQLVVENFNQHRLPGVLLNSTLVFTFSTEVDPASVNMTTIQIWTQIAGKRAEAIGHFEVNGRTVTWFPAMTSKVYPLNVGNSTTTPIMPKDAGLNTAQGNSISYSVLIPAAPSVNTVRSKTGKPLQTPFTSTFDTLRGPKGATPGNSTGMARSFTALAPFFRDTIRVADVLAYGGTVSPRAGFRKWLLDPKSSGGENPLYLWPAWLDGALGGWIKRDRTGERVDQLFGIQLVPPLTSLDMKDNVLPASLPPSRRGDERFISNLKGTQQGRTRAVEGLNIFFTQTVAGDSFLTKTNNPKPYDKSPVTIRVLPKAETDPTTVTPEPFTLTFDNNTETQSALVNITLTRMITQGWIHITILASAIKGMPGGNLEENLPGEFSFIWPVKINAK